MWLAILSIVAIWWLLTRVTRKSTTRTGGRGGIRSPRYAQKGGGLMDYRYVNATGVLDQISGNVTGKLYFYPKGGRVSYTMGQLRMPSAIVISGTHTGYDGVFPIVAQEQNNGTVFLVDVSPSPGNIEWTAPFIGNEARYTIID